MPIFKKYDKHRYGKLPAKVVEVEPYAQVDLYLIWPYSVTTNILDVKGLPIEFILTATTFIDPSMG